MRQNDPDPLYCSDAKWRNAGDLEIKLHLNSSWKKDKGATVTEYKQGKLLLDYEIDFGQQISMR